MSGRNRQRRTVLYSSVAGLDPGQDLPLASTHYARATFQQIPSWPVGKEAVVEHAPCAVIVPLSPQLLDCPEYHAFVAACVARASEREEFRFYVYLVDLTFQAFVALAHSEGPLGQLADTVNIPGVTGSEALSTIDTSLASFLSNLTDIEDTPRCRRRLFRFFAVVSALSIPLSIGALGAFALSAAYYVTATPIPGGILGSLVVAGNSYFLLTTVLLILAQQRYRWLLIIAACVAALLGYVHGPSYLPLLGGLGLALGTDYCRRSWLQLSPVDLSRGNGATPQNSCTQVINPLRILCHGHVFHRSRSVFLSYARRTWCDELVRDLRSHLRHLNTECFLDITDIELGASWRHALEDGIRRATVMVFFDQDEPQEPPRLWHRAELITAAKLREKTGLPRIVVVTPETAGSTALETYREKLRSLANVADFHIVPLSHQRTAEFAETIADTPAAPSGGAGHPLFDLLVIMPVLVLIGTLLPTIAWFSMVLCLSYLSLILPVAKLVLPILGSDLPIPFGVLSMMLFLAGGFGFRAWLHGLHEATVPLVRTHSSVFPAIAGLNVAAGGLFLLHVGPGWWVVSAACFLLAFVGLDHTVRWASAGPAKLKYELRSVTKRM